MYCTVSFSLNLTVYLFVLRQMVGHIQHSHFEHRHLCSAVLCHAEEEHMWVYFVSKFPTSFSHSLSLIVVRLCILTKCSEQPT